MSKKRPHESSTQDSQLIEIFEDLSSLDENIRLTAAHTLIVKHVESRTFEDPLVERILRRLVRGLSSGRKAARVGFSVALAESLNSLIKNASHAQAVSNVSASLLQSLRDQTEVNFQSTKQVNLAVVLRVSPAKSLLMFGTGGQAPLPWPTFWHYGAHTVWPVLLTDR